VERIHEGKDPFQRGGRGGTIAGKEFWTPRPGKTPHPMEEETIRAGGKGLLRDFVDSLRHKNISEGNLLKGKGAVSLLGGGRGEERSHMLAEKKRNRDECHMKRSGNRNHPWDRRGAQGGCLFL